MRIIKYIVFLVCAILVSLVTNETLIDYHTFETYANTSTYTCYFDIHTPEELQFFEQTAKKTNVQLFVLEETLVTAGNIERTFYQVNIDHFDSAYPLSNPYRSITRGTVTEKIRPLSEIPAVRDDMLVYVRRYAGNTTEFFDTVTKQIVMSSRSSNSSGPSPFSDTLWFVWMLFYALILFMSFFYVSCIRREIAIRMCFGFSVARKICGNLLLDAVVCSLLIFAQYGILSQYSTFASVNQYLYCYGIALLCEIIPYFSLFRFHVKDISHRNTAWIRLFRCSYILKFCAAAMLFLSFYMYVTVGIKAISTYRTTQTAEELYGYDILQLRSVPSSEQYKAYHEEIDDDAFAEHQCQNDGYNAFYCMHHKDAMIMRAAEYDEKYDIVFYNENAAAVLNRCLKDELAGCSADVVMLCPKANATLDENEKNSRYEQMLTTYSDFCGLSENVKIETIQYDRNVKIPYFAINDKNLIDFSSNPYIVFCRVAPSDAAVMSASLGMIDSVIAIPEDAQYIQDFEKMNPYVSSSLMDLDKSIQYLNEKSFSELLSVMLFIAIMLTLQCIVTFVLVSFYHKINMKEISILRTFGASFFKKYGKHLILQTVIYIIVGLAGTSLIRNTVKDWDLVIILFVCSAVLDIVLYMIINTILERKNIVKVLKGGFV